jgi:hypothetical protein
MRTVTYYYRTLQKHKSWSYCSDIQLQSASFSTTQKIDIMTQFQHTDPRGMPSSESQKPIIESNRELVAV